jgi:cytidylate kinase
MESQLIISIGREFGSGGHEIAQKLSEHYGIKLWDHNLMEEIAKVRNQDIEDFNGLDEKKPLFSKSVRGYSSSLHENVANLQFEYLRKMAAKGESFVIVGRCSETILAEYDCMVSIFVLGDREVKKERVKRIYGLTDKEAEKKMDEKDAARKKYHNYHCPGKWGDSRIYDLSINSSRLGIDATVAILTTYIDDKMAAQK